MSGAVSVYGGVPLHADNRLLFICYVTFYTLCTLVE